MSTGAAGDAFLRGMFEGCIPGGDSTITRRPYHKNCKCALHGGSRAHCARHSKYNNVSYPIRRSWSDGCLAVMGNAPPPCSPSSPAEISRSNSRLVLCREEDDEEEEESRKKSNAVDSSPKVKIEV